MHALYQLGFALQHFFGIAEFKDVRLTITAFQLAKVALNRTGEKQSGLFIITTFTIIFSAVEYSHERWA